MSIFEAILLGIIQGITEFLPISSSGHLVLFQNIFKFQDATIKFNVILHSGTLISLIFVLRRETRSILRTLKSLPYLAKKYNTLESAYQEHETVHLIVLLTIGSISTASTGLLVKNLLPSFLKSQLLVGLALLITGTILWSSKLISTNKKNILDITIIDSLIIGFLQGVAIIPGISRSGITISAGIILGINHKSAGQFSFLLSIPTILGALCFSLFSSEPTIGIKSSLIVAGLLASSIVGFITLKFMFFLVNMSKLHIFTPYCYILSLIIIIYT